MSGRTFRPGARFLLPSGRVVQIIAEHHDGISPVVSCGYVDWSGRMRGEGEHRRHRLSLRTTWIAKHGRPTL